MLTTVMAAMQGSMWVLATAVGLTSCCGSVRASLLMLLAQGLPPAGSLSTFPGPHSRRQSVKTTVRTAIMALSTSSTSGAASRLGCGLQLAACFMHTWLLQSYGTCTVYDCHFSVQKCRDADSRWGTTQHALGAPCLSSLAWHMAVAFKAKLHDAATFQWLPEKFSCAGFGRLKFPQVPLQPSTVASYMIVS